MKKTGIVKHRTLAKEMCESGCVRVDGREVKAGKEIAPGNTITLETREELLEIEVADLPDRNHKRREGQAFYRIRVQKYKEPFF